MNKKVATIVVTYNRLSLLQECIDSLRRQSYCDHSIIVVNNGSTDNTLAWLESQNDLIIITQDNLGGAGGFFTGIKYACEQGYDYSWIMDDDVVTDKDALLNLMGVSNLAKGFLCSRVVDIDGNPCNVPKVSTNKNTRTSELRWGELLDKQMIGVDITSFVSVLIPNKLPLKLGLPYKEYFIWGDDSEYTSRISRLYASYMVLNSVVVHKRKIQGVLSIYTEVDKKRIDNYFYAYRNRIHSQSSYLKKVAMWGFSFTQSIQLLIMGDFYKSIVIWKALGAVLLFSPSIKYPNIGRC